MFHSKIDFLYNNKNLKIFMNKNVKIFHLIKALISSTCQLKSMYLCGKFQFQVEEKSIF